MKLKLFLFATVLFAVGAVNAQGKYGATPEDSTACVQNISLYQEFYKQKNYADAYSPWSQCLVYCPKSSKNLYIKGSTILKYQIKAAKDNPERKTALIDSLFMLYDMRIENYGQEGYVLGRKAADWSKLHKSDIEGTLALYQKSFELQGNKAEPAAVAGYYQTMYKASSKGIIEKTALLENYSPVMEVISFNKDKYKEANNQKKLDSWIKVEGVVNDIFTQVASCDDIVALYTPKYEAAKDDAELLKQILEIMEKRDCTDADLFVNVAMSLDAIEPSSTSKVNIGIALVKKERYSEALGYLKEAGELSTDDEEKVKAFKYAGLCALQQKSYASAKSYAKKILAIDPNNAEAYLTIGNAYLYGSTSVGDNVCEQHLGYLAAIDKYNKAKSLDSSLAERANKLIASAKKQYPKKSECFFVGIQEGQSYTIGGWINETVTVKVQE